MFIEELIQQVNEMWDGNNIPCDYGCSPEHLETMKNEAKRLYPNKPYCAAAQWIWTDLVVSDEDEKLFSQRGVNPCFVRCLEVIEDEVSRPHITKTVRSTALVEFHSNCIFVTRNTSYILVGPGHRISINPEVLKYLVAW